VAAARKGQRVKCRSCGGADFGDVIDLGLMPLVNNLLLRADEPSPRWPLKVVFCKACSLAQLTETPPPSSMFDEYLYFSSQSQTMVAHAGELVRRFVKRPPAPPAGQRVVEIASNDGYLLRQARDIAGAQVLGIDPARNIATHANAAGVPTRCEYFNIASADAIARQFGLADVIFANNVLAHVPDPNEIAAGIKRLLSPDGLAHVEVPALTRMIELCAFDTIYHEHHCYFSFSALRSLFNRHGLRIVDFELAEIHGGSWHLQLAHEGDESKAAHQVDIERKLGVFDDSYYTDFEARVKALKNRLLEVLKQFDSVAAFGAAAKGIVLLNSFGLDTATISWVADVSPHKQGRFVPGMRQEIVAPEMLLSEKPQVVLILPWNIKDEIIQRNSAYLNQGGRFIVPIPEVAIL
jgi:SAM-dependent methyltransferase